MKNLFTYPSLHKKIAYVAWPFLVVAIMPLISLFIECSYDCNSRGALKILDVEMPDAQIGKNYNMEVTGTDWLFRIMPKDSSQIPSGLVFIEELGKNYLRGNPTDTGLFKILMQGSEHGTQCVGRDADFFVKIKITR